MMPGKTLHARLILILLGFLAFAPTLRVGLLVDDHTVIENSPTIRRWSWQAVREDFTSNIFHNPAEANYYRPLYNLLTRAEYSGWKFRPLGYHLVNLLFHIGCALMLFELLPLMGVSREVTLIAASLFAVHPVATDLMMVASAGEEQMAYFFSLLTIFLALGGAWRYAVSLLTLGLALFTKETAILTPVFFMTFLMARRAPLSEYRRALPMAAASVLYFLWHRHIMGPMLSSSDWHWVPRFFFRAFPQIVVRYIGLYLWPLSLHYPRLIPPLSHAWPIFLIAELLLLALALRYRHRMSLFCILWMVIALLPKTPVMIRGYSMMDHWFYPASLGVLLPLAFGFERMKRSTPFFRKLGLALYVGLLIFWGSLVHWYAHVRGTDEGMYRWTIRFEPGSMSARYKLGEVLLNKNRPDLAQPYLEEAYALDPANAETTRVLAIALARQRQYPRAIELLEQLLRRNPASQEDQYLLRKIKALAASNPRG